MISEFIDVPQETIVSQPWRKPDCTEMETLEYVKFFDDVQTIKVKFISGYFINPVTKKLILS